MKIRKLIILFVLLAFVPKFASTQQSNEDSVRIVHLFQTALQLPEKADSLLLITKTVVKSNQKSLALLDTYLYSLSKYLFQTAQLDSAFSTASLGIKIHQDNSLNYKTSKFHNILGSIYSYQKEYELAIYEFQESIKILEIHNDIHQVALIKNNIANLFFSILDYETAYKYSIESYAVLKAENDTVYLPSLSGITAISAINLGKLDEGKKLAEECLFLSEKYNNPIGLIVGNHSLGELNLSKHNYKLANAHFLSSLDISTKINHRHFMMLNKVGLLISNVRQQNYTEALSYGLEALEESKQLENENTWYSIHKHLGYAYFGNKKYKNAYTNLNTAHDIFIATADTKNKKIINDILIKYDTEKIEKEIIANELTIAQDEIRLNKRKLWIIGLSAILILLLTGYYVYNRTQKYKLLQLQKIEEQRRVLALISGEENERKRISNELHDGLASSITAIKIQLEHYNISKSNDSINKLVKQLSQLHEETRRISHNLMPINLKELGFIDSLANFCKENTSPSFKIQFVNMVKTTLELKPVETTVLYRVVQEVINNVQKHAKSDFCIVQTSYLNNNFIISIEDEGIGFDPKKIQGNQGLNSIRQRITDLGGDFIVESKAGEGTLILIQLRLKA